jgi:TolB protein
MILRNILLAAALALPVSAQTPAPNAPAPASGGAPIRVDITGGISQPMPIAIPVMPTPASTGTAAGNTDALGAQLSQVISGDLKGSGLFTPLSAGQLRPVTFPQVTAPDYGGWLGTGAQALIQGFVQANGDGTLTVGCYLYDVFAKQELTRQGFVVKPSEWRRAAHKCADMVYTRLTGEGPYFDSQVIYGRKDAPDQAAGDHGSGWREPPLHHQWPGTGADSALCAEPPIDRLHVFRE